MELKQQQQEHKDTVNEFKDATDLFFMNMVNCQKKVKSFNNEKACKKGGKEATTWNNLYTKVANIVLLRSYAFHLFLYESLADEQLVSSTTSYTGRCQIKGKVAYRLSY